MSGFEVEAIEDLMDPGQKALLRPHIAELRIALRL